MALKRKGKFVAVISTALVLAILGTGIFYSHERVSSKEENIAVKYTSNETIDSLAKMYNVDDVLFKAENGEYVRFEAIKGQPIDVIVDEDSVWCMTDNNIQAIKNTIEAYNKFFSMINPDIQLRYISSKEYKKNPTENSCITISSLLRIQTNGGSARAITSPMDPKESKFGNGMVSNNAAMFLSSTALANLDIKEIESIIIHEFGHAFGVKAHSEDEYSIMNAYGKGSAISSNIMSKDLMYALTASYYNPKTSPFKLQDIYKYIENNHEMRVKEIIEYNDQLKQEKAQENEKSFYEKAEIFAKQNNTKLSTPTIKGCKTYTQTSIYGQLTKIVLTQDTYTMTITNADGSTLTTSGTFTVEQNFLRCSGDIVSNSGGNLHVVSDQNMYIGFLENNDILLCIDGYIHSSLSEKTPNSDMVLE